MTDSSNTPLHVTGTCQDDYLEFDEFSQYLINYLSDFIVIKDQEGRWLVANDYVIELFGLQDVSYQGKTNVELAEFSRPDCRHALLHCEISDSQVWVERSPLPFTEQVPQPTGSVVNLQLLKVPVFHPDGKPKRLFVIGRDVTEQVHAMYQLKGNEDRLRALVAQSIDVFVISDENGFLHYISHAVDYVLGYKSEEHIGNNIFDYIHEDDRKLAENLYWTVLQNPDQLYQKEIRFKHANGSWVLCELVGRNLLCDPNIKGIVINYRDITEMKDAQKTIEYMAYHDYLTNLYNRRYFEKQLQTYIDTAKTTNKEFAIMYLDLDRFKYVNDSLGHLTGDQLIVAVAQRLSTCMRPHAIFARIGGDEFAVFLPDADCEHSIALARLLLEQFKNPFYIEDFELNITCSIGITVYPGDGETTETLVKNADIALYRAKEQGKNQFQIFKPDMKVQTYKSFQMQQDLRKAIERKELEVYYQPKVHPCTGEIISAEALLRWNHNDWGVVSPAEFIPIAEDTGLILPIGEWILHTVCQQMHVWQQSHLTPIPVSINVSGKQLIQKQFVSTIQKALDKVGLDSKWLEIEITESTILQNTAQNRQTIQDLQRIGSKIAVDDFGTGYSSLAMLTQVKPDILKIDRSFIQNIQKSEEDLLIIQTIIGLAHGLGQLVVAEGVEQVAQLELLLALDCDQIQGYLFSKPVPANEFEELLKRRTLKPNLTV